MSAAVSKSFEEIVADDMHLRRLRKMHRRAADWISKLGQCVKVTGRGGLAVGEGSQEDTERRVEGEAEGLAGRVARKVDLMRETLPEGRLKRSTSQNGAGERLEEARGLVNKKGNRIPRRARTGTRTRRTIIVSGSLVRT